jgi:AraC-like DNA-binding protein
MMEGAWVVFAGGDEAGLRECIPQNQAYARINDPNRLILSKLHAAAVVGTEKGAAGFWEAQAILCSLLHLLRQLAPAVAGGDLTTASVPAPDSFVKTVDAFLSGRVGSSVSLAEIAKAVHVSPSTLSHRYAAESGRSPLAAFQAMRLEVARALLMQGLKLDAVAGQTGFCDAYHLSKAFSRHFAMSPAEYRRRIHGSQG